METNNKLRKALTKILHLTNSLDENCAVDPVEIRDIAKAALAEPFKNCDVGTVEEQFARFRKFCKKGSMDSFEATAYCAYECPCGNNYDCKLAWAQMPYEGGEK